MLVARFSQLTPWNPAVPASAPSAVKIPTWKPSLSATWRRDALMNSSWSAGPRTPGTHGIHGSRCARLRSTSAYSSSASDSSNRRRDAPRADRSTLQRNLAAVFRNQSPSALFGPSPPDTKEPMTSRLARLLPALAMLLALALPAVASAHGGDRDRGHGHRGARACRAVQNGHVPRGLTAAQAHAVATACTTRANALAAARTAFNTATASALA